MSTPLSLRRLAIIGLATLSGATAQATTYLVNPDGTGDFPTIHAAILACGHGDVVELADGVYSGPGNRDLTNNETAVLIRSQSGNPFACVINCEGSAAEPHRFITLVITGEKSREVWGLHDLTVTGGYHDAGAAVQVYDWASPQIRGCVFRQNEADLFGGAIFGAVGYPMIDDCEFVENTAPQGGAIAGLTECSFQISGCTFRGNTAEEGGALYSHSDLGTQLTACTFVRNQAPLGAALSVDAFTGITLTRCLVAFNLEGAAVHVASGQVDLVCCDLFGNTGGDWVGPIADQLGVAGNIALDPLFCDLGQDDLHLQEISPCAPSTDPNPECDQIGAWAVGCGPIGVEADSWGSLKARFR